MKKKNIFSLLLILLISVSCTDQLRKDQLEQAEIVDRLTSARYLLAGSIVRISTFYQEKAFSDDKFLAIEEYYQQLFSVKSQTYEEFTKAPSNWGREYKLLYDTKAGIDVANKEGVPSTAAAQKILQAFMYEYVTNIYGDIPFTEALRGREGIIQPKFDKQEDVYAGLLKQLDEAVNTLKTSTDEIDSDQDLMFHGDKEKWIRFANSLMIRLVVNSYEASGGSRKAQLEQLSKGLMMDDNEYNAAMPYEGTNDDNSWYYGQTGDDNELTRRKPAATLVEALINDHDPRLTAWIAPAKTPWSDTIASGVASRSYTVSDYYGNEFTIQLINTETADNADIYAGFPLNSIYVGAPVKSNVTLKLLWGDESGDAYDNWKMSSFNPYIFGQRSHPLFPASLMEASEVMFLLAEAAQRGWITGSASDYYEKAVRLNMERWGIKETDINSYLAAHPLPADATDALKTILWEKWKSLFIQAPQAWFTYRRTGYPVPTAVANNINAYPFPLRWRYPTYEVDNNTDNVDEAVSRLNPPQDIQDAKMWILNNVTPVQ